MQRYREKELTKVFQIFLLMALLAGCARPEGDGFTPKSVNAKATRVNYEPVDPIDIKDATKVPHTKQVVITADGKSVEVKKESYVEPERTNFFEEAKLLYDFAEKNELDSVQKELITELSRIYNVGTYMNRAEAGDMPFTEVFISIAQPEYRKATANLIDLFEGQGTGVLNLLQATKHEVPLPPKPISLSSALNYLTKFMRTFENKVTNSKTLEKGLKEGVLKAFDERFWMKIPQAEQQIAAYERAKQFDKAIQVLIQFINTFEIELTEDELAQLTEAEQIGANLNRQMDEKEIFALLIQLWEGMTPEERVENFASVSPELHEYLSDRSDKARECLKKRKCKKLGLKIVRNLFILPKIKKHGVENIQKQIQSAAFEELNATLSETVYEAVSTMADGIYTEIRKELDREYAFYNGIRSNFGTFAKREIEKWMKDSFGRTSIPALEDGSLVMADDYKALKKASTNRFDAEVFGDALTTTPMLLKSPHISKQQVALIKINQLLAHGGYTKVNGQGSGSIARRRGQPSSPVNVLESVDIKNYLAYHSGATPQGYSAYQSKTTPKLTGAELTSMMRGMREMITTMGDWKPNPTWKKIENLINAKDILASIDSNDLNQTAAPQDAMLALSVANYALLISNFGGAGSPLFFYCPEGKNAWMSQGQKCDKDTSLVSANPDRSTTIIKAKDHAELVIEVIEYHKLIDSLKKTKSTYLKDPQKKGERSAVTQLSDAQKDLDMLVFGLSQFLSSQFIDEIGRVAAEFDIGERKGHYNKTDIQASLLAISALSKSAQFRQTPIYANNALAAFDYLYLAFYDEKIKFFKEKSGSPSRVTMALAIQAVQDLGEAIGDVEQKRRLSKLQHEWTAKLIKML